MIADERARIESFLEGAAKGLALRYDVGDPTIMGLVADAQALPGRFRSGELPSEVALGIVDAIVYTVRARLTRTLRTQLLSRDTTSYHRRVELFLALVPLHAGLPAINSDM